MRRPLVVLAAACLLQFTLTSTGHAVGTTVDQTINASTQREVRVAGHEVPKISNPRVRVFFDVAPDLIGVSVNTYAADANPDDAQCEVGHDPTGAGTANMTVVADLKAGATGNREILVSYEHLHTETDPDTIHTHEELNTKDPIGPVGPAGEELRVPVCIQE